MRCFSSLGSPRRPMDSAGDQSEDWGCPIRRSGSQRVLASRPGFSQRATSFIASQCQGIHQMPFSCLISRFPKQSGATRRDKPRHLTTNIVFSSRKDASPRASTHGSARPVTRPDKTHGLARGPRFTHIHNAKYQGSEVKSQWSGDPDHRRSTFQSKNHFVRTPAPSGGGERNRTDDLMLAKHALYQLSYTPSPGDRSQKSQVRNTPRLPTSDFCNLIMVGQGGFEPPTSRLSSARSNQLSY
jgi:hypothetical protein